MRVFSKKQRLAYFINLYNIMTLKLVKDNYLLIKKKGNTIKSVGGILKSCWDKNFFTLFGKETSLNDIEHGFIRGEKFGFAKFKKEYSDPRVHFALNCASKSCPPLMPTCFEADRLDNQLQNAMTGFLKDRSVNYLKGDSAPISKLVISPIFKWYRKDFSVGVNKNTSLTHFLQKNAKYLADSHLQVSLIERGDFDVSFGNYDWTLNDVDKNSI